MIQKCNIEHANSTFKENKLQIVNKVIKKEFSMSKMLFDYHTSIPLGNRSIPLLLPLYTSPLL